MGSKAYYKMLNRFPWLSTVKAKMVLSIFALLAAWELCIDFCVIGLGGDGGAPGTESGEVLIENRPESDAEFVAAAVDFLQEIDWWQDGVSLARIGRQFECSQVYTASEHEFSLFFRVMHRTTLLVGAEDQMWMEFVDKRTTLQYRLEEFDHAEFRSYEGLDLSQVKVDSIRALGIAELSGGEVFRASIADRCNIDVALWSNEKDWRIRYNSEDNYLLLAISSLTGEVVLKEGPLVPEG